MREDGTLKEGELELGIVRNVEDNTFSIYIRTRTPAKYVMESDEAKVFVMQMVQYIQEVDVLNSKYETIQ